jgi:Tfp pilus assembly protein PilO
VTRRTELLVAAVGVVLVLAVGTLLLVRPKQQAVAEARADRNAAIAESQALGDHVRALEALKADAAKLRAQADQVKEEFPATPNLPGLVDALEDAAGAAGVDLISISPTAPKASTVQPELAEISTAISVAGGYFQIEDFLSRVENLVRGSDPKRVPPRSVLVQSVNVSSSAGGGAGDSAAATPDPSATPERLQASIFPERLPVGRVSGRAGVRCGRGRDRRDTGEVTP